MECGRFGRFAKWAVVVCMISVSACETPTIPTKGEDSTTGPEKPVLPEEPSEGDRETYSTVSDAQNVFESGLYDSLMYVKAYVVGAVGGNSIKKAVFTLPTDIETNVLLADNPGETDYHRCLPVRLEKGTNAREELNLSFHPENKGKCIVIGAFIEKYFSVAGIRNPLVYAWMDGEKPLPDEIPETLEYPTFDEAEAVIQGGR